MATCLTLWSTVHAAARFAAVGLSNVERVANGHTMDYKLIKIEFNNYIIEILSILLDYK